MLINGGVVLKSKWPRYTSGGMAMTAWTYWALLNNTCIVGLWYLCYFYGNGIFYRLSTLVMH